MGLITQLIGNYQQTKLAEQQQKMAGIGRELQVNQYVLMDPTAKPDDKQAAQLNIDRLLDQYGGPQAKVHRPMISTMLRGLAGGVLGGLGVQRPGRPPQTPAGQPPAPAGQPGGVDPQALVPGAIGLRFGQVAPPAPATPASLAGRQPQRGQAGALTPVSSEALGRARLSVLAGGPETQKLEQERWRLHEAAQRGDITPAEEKEGLRDIVLPKDPVAQARAIEQAKVDIDAAQAEGDRTKALQRLEGIKNIIPADEYTRMRAELETGVKLSAAMTRAPSINEQTLQHALAVKAAKLNKRVDQLTDQEWLEAQKEAKEGAADEGPAYDPDKLPPTLKPGERNEEALRGLPEGTVRVIKALVNYQYPMPSGGFALGNPKSPWIKLLSLAEQYDPTFDASQYQVRLATKKDFLVGKAAANIRSINTLVGHLASLDKSAQELGNIHSGALGPFTSLANMARTAWRTAEQEPKLKTFNDDVNAVETELAAVFKGTGASDQEIKAWRAKIDASSSPEELRAHVLEAVNLMKSRMEAMQSQWETAMGRPFEMRFLSPEAELKLRRLTGDAADAGAADAAAAATGGGTVKMRAPTGEVQDVPADQVEHYRQRGAVVVQ